MSSSEQIEIRAVATNFFDAIEKGDIETMRSGLAPNAEIWHNTDEHTVGPEITAQILAAMVRQIRNIKYSDRRLTVFPGGFVQQHCLEGNRIHDGGKVRLPCAIICKAENGKISRLDEYFDSVHQATFRKMASKV